MPVMTKTPSGDDIVILSRAEYDSLMAHGDEYGDDDSADAAHANRMLARVADGSETILTDAEMDELLAAKTPLAFWRKKRGFTQARLSKSLRIAQGFISEIENGSKTGDVHTLAGIARLLNVSLDDLVVEPERPVKKAGLKARSAAARSGRSSRQSRRGTGRATTKTKTRGG
jgi:DNA-binding XRE family transcriptional regulator